MYTVLVCERSFRHKTMTSLHNNIFIYQLIKSIYVYIYENVVEFAKSETHMLQEIYLIKIFTLINQVIQIRIIN